MEVAKALKPSRQDAGATGTHLGKPMGPFIVEIRLLECAVSRVSGRLLFQRGRDGYSVFYTRAQGAISATWRWRVADGSLRSLLARLSRIDVSGDRRLGHGTVVGARAPRLLGDLRRSLSSALNHPYVATAGFTLARADRRSHIG